MKNKFRFFTTVISLLLTATILLAGCMYAIAEDNGEAKHYDLKILSETIAEQGGTVIDNSPTSQSELQKKFSDMAEISDNGRSITVISQEFLDNYWQDIKNGKRGKALTTAEVMYIIQDSVRICFEYEEYTLCANLDFLQEHSKMVERTAIPNGTLTVSTPDESMLESNFNGVLSDIHGIILYRLAALSTPGAFIFADEAIIAAGGKISDFSGNFAKSVFYVPSDAPEKDFEVLVDFIMGKPETAKQVRIFDLSYFGDTRILFYNYGATESLYPTAEMIATQADRVVDIIDRTVTEGIPTDQAEEAFWETERFIYYFPSIRSQYVIAVMYDGREMLLTEALEKGYIGPEELDNFALDYIRMVKHTVFDKVEVPYYNATAVYTDKLRNDGIFPYANLINSTTELAQYTNEIIANEVYDIDRSTAKIPSYREMYESYNGNWFENNSLIILVVESDSEILPKIASITVVPDEQIEVHIKESSLGEKNNQVYTVFIETNKIEADIINISND